uniref:P2X purinoceptor 4 n=1 Tax=Echinococcus granulosus TaxID=6210 RepID=A0A068WH93_ECHGR|nr:p2X purinoceptor 4 [Echinococcus granulosus]
MNCKRVAEFLFTYETPKMVEITNYKIGIFHRLLQIAITVYVVCWVLIYDKGYQENDEVVSSTVTKTKGLMVERWAQNEEDVAIISDAADIVNPPLENNAFFVTTHRIVTPRQTSSRCPGIRNSKKSSCGRDGDCEKMQLSLSEAGARTGKCVDFHDGKGVCEIYAWCPLENDTIVLSYNLQTRFEMISNYTVYIKNDIEYPKFHIKRRNRDAWVSNKPLGSCRYNPSDELDKYCPIFRLGTIFEEVGLKPSALTRGGVIGIIINWDCNLDWGAGNCKPSYSFTNLDVDNDGNSGFNFRYAYRYRENGTLYRDLVKAIGLRFSIFVHGQAGSLSIIPLLLNLGSGLALLGMAPTICDIIILNIVGSKNVYKDAKFEVLTKDEISTGVRKSIPPSHSRYAIELNSSRGQMPPAESPKGGVNGDENPRVVMCSPLMSHHLQVSTLLSI